VADLPTLWLPGALAWTVVLGWMPLVVAVARPPTQAELTFLGAGIVTSGAWPANALLAGGVALGVVLLAFGLVAAANATLTAILVGRSPTFRDTGRLLRIGIVASLPLAVAAGAFVVAAALIAPREFNDPQPASGGPVVGTALRVAPIIGLVIAAAVAGSVTAAVAGWHAMRRDLSAFGSLRAVPRSLVGLGLAAAAHVVATVAAHAAYLLLAGLLLSVLWAPIGAGLESGAAIGFTAGVLLVGFVAIWLCLVLAGGALHAWSAMTWSRLLEGD